MKCNSTFILKACSYVTSQTKSLGFPTEYSCKKCEDSVSWFIILFLAHVAFKKVMLNDQLQKASHLLLH